LAEIQQHQAHNWAADEGGLQLQEVDEYSNAQDEDWEAEDGLAAVEPETTLGSAGAHEAAE
jgi:hypothetical protein